MLLWKNLNPYPTLHVYEEQNVNLCECKVESFICYSSNRYIICHNGYRPYEHRDIEKQSISVS